jgi:Na+-translocating ferredoxin:NAD+ oxidoreductase RNF subunit RnfB
MEYGIFLLLFAMLLCALAWATMYCGFFDKPGLRTAHLQEKINALLPQTQCGKCHYEACRPYAAAIATGEADINAAWQRHKKAGLRLPGTATGICGAD